MLIFEYHIYVHSNNGQLEYRSGTSIFLGYPNGVKGYKVWLTEPNTLKSIVSENLIFNDNTMLHPKNESVSPDTMVRSFEMNKEIQGIMMEPLI